MQEKTGDDVVFNTLGATTSARALVARVQQAWACEDFATGTLCTEPAFALHDFVLMAAVDPRLAAWASGGWQEQSLILSGGAGLGKTEFACALLHAVTPAHAYHFVNKIDRVRDISFGPGEGLLVDEVSLSSRDVDDAKALVDVAKGRDIACRNRDGFIPKGTARIFCTNWAWERFWPGAAGLAEHSIAIERRVVWITVAADLRNPRSQGSAAPTLPVVDHTQDAARGHA